MVTITKIGEEYNSQILEISGLSTDPKPVDKIDGVSIANGSTFKEIDTGKEYTYNESAEIWHVNKTASSSGGSGVDGEDGITPHIGENGNWFIGTVDTGVPAQGPAGENGVTPHIGTNGNWYIGSTNTGVSAKGVKGDTGEPGAKGDKGDTGAQGEPGKDGSDGKDGISATHSWNGTVLSITSASGTSSVDLKGEKGDTGATGQKGDTGAKGDDGADGGHYTPIVTQPTSDTMQISFTPSKSDMPNVNPVTVNLPVSENSGENVAQVEPAYSDIPMVFFSAPLQQTKDEIVCEFWYYSKTMKFHGWAEIKAQGNSTLSWAKKNQTVKLYKDAACTEKFKVNFKGWGKQYKFVIKAYWRDLTHTRDVGSVRLESECAKTRPGYDTMPELLRTSPNMGGIDGFPVLVYADGVYQGRYMWNIPKDAWMANMDDELDTHCILCSEGYGSGLFRAAANIDGNDWTDEIHDSVPDSIKTRWNEVISFVRNATDEEFVANLNSYIDVESLIDRHLMGLVSCDFDGYGKNQLYITYDGQKWYAVPYDKDGTWGVFWIGETMLPSDYGRNQYEDMSNGNPGNLLFIRLEQLFYGRLQERWSFLRENTLSVANIIARMRELSDITPPHIVAEDYASTTAGGAFTGIPMKNTCTIQQIQTFAAERHAWTDEYVAGLTPVVPVPCTGIALDKSTLAFAGAGMQTLTATVTPEDTTDAVLWSSDNAGVASVSNAGVVTAVSNGTATITATCGAYSATCAVTVEGIGAVEPVYSLAQATTFNGTSDYVDTGVKLYDTAKDWTILLGADLTQGASGQMSVLHCIKEVSPWAGVCLQTQSSFADPASGKYSVGGAGVSGSNTYVAVPATATKVAIRCVSGNINMVAYLNNGNVISTPITKETYAAYDGNLLLGCYQDTSGNKGRYWKGTISQCDVYFDALSDEMLTAFLEE